jgi:hypothetical protein
MNLLRRPKVSFLLLATFVVAANISASAATQWVGAVTIGTIALEGPSGSLSPGSGGTIVYFGVSPAPANTCTFYDLNLQFDGTTPQGKNMYAMLLSAKSQNKTIDIWYEDSPTPGTNQTNGCTNVTLSQVDGIAIH